ncbi:MAG: M23 family metallopeptidase [Bacilli bacterium]|nr:M23 family metallopeptidase [Bacilli bacterium]
MKLLGSERIVTQSYERHRYAEDYAGLHLSDILINGKAKVITVINKYKPYEDTIDRNDYINNKPKWKDGVHYNCVSISGKIVRYHQSELGGNQVKLECFVNNKKYYLRILHMAHVFVKVGDLVDAQTVIGTQGNTGLVLSKKERTNPTYGSHVHFEVMDENYNKINPRDFANFKIEVVYKEQTNEIDNTKKQISIIANKINIRENSSVETEIIGGVYNGEIYTVYDEVINDKYIWYKIKTSFDLVGYVANEKGKNWLEVFDVNENIESDYHQVDEDKEKVLVFECPKDEIYAIKLKKGEKLYIE